MVIVEVENGDGSDNSGEGVGGDGNGNGLQRRTFFASAFPSRVRSRGNQSRSTTKLNATCRETKARKSSRKIPEQ